MDVLTAVDPDRIASDRASKHEFWLDLIDPRDDEVDRLGELLGLHPVALEDTREFGQRPKVDVYEEHVLTRPRRDQLGAIYRLRQEVRMIGRIASVQQDQFAAASNDLER